MYKYVHMHYVYVHIYGSIHVSNKSQCTEGGMRVRVRLCVRTCVHFGVHMCARAVTPEPRTGGRRPGRQLRESPCSRAEQRSLRAAGEWEAEVAVEDVEVGKSAGTWVAERAVEEEYVPGSARRRWSR